MKTNYPKQKHMYLPYLYSPNCLNWPELKIHIGNVAQDTSVYYSVSKTAKQGFEAFLAKSPELC